MSDCPYCLTNGKEFGGGKMCKSVELKTLKKEYEESLSEQVKLQRKLKKEIKPFLFLFTEQSYVDSKEFKYSKKEKTFGGNSWFVRIYYSYDNVFIRIDTGTVHYNFAGTHYEHDNPPDFDKITLAFKRCIEQRQENVGAEVSLLKKGISLFQKMRKITEI